MPKSLFCRKRSWLYFFGCLHCLQTKSATVAVGIVFVSRLSGSCNFGADFADLGEYFAVSTSLHYFSSIRQKLVEK